MTAPVAMEQKTRVTANVDARAGVVGITKIRSCAQCKRKGVAGVIYTFVKPYSMTIEHCTACMMKKAYFYRKTAFGHRYNHKEPQKVASNVGQE